MTVQSDKRSKKHTLAASGFLGRIIFLILLAGLFCVILNAYLYYLYVVGSYDFILKQSNLSQEIIDERYSELYTLWVALTLVSSVIIIFITTWALFLARRVTGPIYHIKRVISELGSGNSSARVHLREKDQFHDLAISFNELIDELQKK